MGAIKIVDLMMSKLKQNIIYEILDLPFNFGQNGKNFHRSKRQQNLEKIQEALIPSVLNPIKRGFWIILILFIIQVLALGLIPFINGAGILPIIFSPTIVISFIWYAASSIFSLPFRSSGFQNLEKPDRSKIIVSLKQKDWGNQIIAIYMSCCIDLFLEFDKRQKKIRQERTL